MNYQDESQSRQQKYSEIAREFREKGIRFLQLLAPDLHGRMQSRIECHVDLTAPMRFCTYVFSATPEVIPSFVSPYVGNETGFECLPVMVDPDSIRVMPWKPGFALGILDFFTRAGGTYPLDIRQPLRKLENELLKLGMSALFSAEIEFWLFKMDVESIKNRQFEQLKPWGQSRRTLDECPQLGWSEFLSELGTRLSFLGIELTSANTEHASGLYEVSLKPQSPLLAGDSILLTRQAIRDLASERGLMASFMPTMSMDKQNDNAGAHFHQSLIDLNTGKNLFADKKHKISGTGLHYLAGLLNFAREMHLVYCPTINGIRRLKKTGYWKRKGINWGYEDKLVMLSVIHGGSSMQSRIEFRVPGSDSQPHLAIAAMLASGLQGISEKLEPTLPVQGKNKTRGLIPLPDSIPGAIKAFTHSGLAAVTFGFELKDHYCLSRKHEYQAFRQWQDNQVSEFEYRRYFQGL